MAVNVFAVRSVCLYCKTTSEQDSEKEFHEIFDEVGVELQLPTLVEKFFQLKLGKEGKQVLCDECVNRLIELYDLEEHAKAEGKDERLEDAGLGKRDINEGEPNLEANKKGDKEPFKGAVDIPNSVNDIPNVVVIRNKCEDIKIGYTNDKEIPKVSEEFTNLKIKENTKNISYKTDTKVSNNKSCAIIQSTIPKTEDIPPQGKHQETGTRNNIESSPSKEYIPSKLMKETLNQIEYADIELLDDLTVDDNDINNDLEEIESANEIGNIQTTIPKTNEKFTYEDFPEDEELENVLSDNSDDDKSNVSNYIEVDSDQDELQEIELENETQNVLYDLTGGDDTTTDSEFLIIGTHAVVREPQELETNETQTDAFEEPPNVEEFHSQTTDTSHNSNPNQFVEEHIYEEEQEEDTLLECISQKTTNSSNDYHVESWEESEDDHSEDVGHIVEDLETTKQNRHDNILEIDDSLDLNSQKTSTDQENVIAIEEVTQSMQDENLTTEEEYLVEEIIRSEEFDYVDLNEYFDNVLMTKFEQLELQWTVECKLCLQKYETLQDLLKHSCINELFEDGEQQGCCIFNNCDETASNLKALARHFILQHYDKIDGLPIYSRCPDCDKNFSNFIDLNKHSCCRNIKRKAGARNYCQSCEMDFQSLKRYVFHMQFHLTKHRPKVCLLCGALFNNSNDLFNHTQYTHEPESAMACVTCDRFFKDIAVYESHLELHDESKYKFSCTYCPKKYTKKNALTVHMDVYHKHKITPLQCGYCEKVFATNASYSIHLKSHTPEAEVAAFVCSECGLISSHGDLVKDHIEKESGCNSAMVDERILLAAYTCENCSIDFQSKQDLQNHRLSANHSDKFFYCCMCRKAFKTLRHMRNHVTNHKDYDQWQDSFPIARLYMCNIGECQEAYPLWSSLYYHKQKPHSNGKDLAKEFKCQFCQQLCPSKMSLAVHVARSHNKTNVSCTECKKTFKNEKLLTDHIDKFHTEVQCSDCKKTFKNRRNMESHQLSVHRNKKRYFCRHCKKGYFFNSEKEQHEKNVHSEISYKCELCFFTTNYEKSFEVHLKKHNNQLDYNCPFCHKSFGRKQQLDVHVKTHQYAKDPKEVATKRKRPFEKNDYYTLLDDNQQTSKRQKNAVDITINSFEHDALDLILENEISIEELRSDSEF